MVLIQLTIFFIIIYVLESLTIIAQSSFMVAVLGRKWMQVKRLSSVEMILISLGICHFCLQWASVLYNFGSYFNNNYTFWNIAIIWEFTNILIFWLTSLLAVFYCVKISSFTHPIFLWLRWRILRLVPWLLLGTLILSCVAVIPSVIRNRKLMQSITMKHLPGNSTWTERFHLFEQYFFKVQTMGVLLVPFLLFLASTVLVMASLIRHREQMQQHNSGHCNSSMQAHHTALKSLATFFIVFTSYFLILVIQLVSKIFGNGSLYWLWEAIIYALISLHSTSLMLSSPTLKRVLKMKCWGPEAT
ncbi:taste receptor type 2 member 16 [Ictidomys tridecemlineatus]|uniref:taste receptor type 2 member 16 n=1 Tax=Ictidomys tridecemlineatus TaxID=43179 RepID=UPI00038BEA09|nr:taste receptor type 2 member 16 [Ictidomys tridecemlineatus]KAG3277721.1 taste 2 receptor member 16 [Ictidomys tridecemlineatus]